MNDLKMPPNNKITEQAFLGSLMRHQDLIDESILLLNEDDFYYDAHQKIFSAISSIHAAGRKVDAVGLFQALIEKKQHADIGGAVYLAELWECDPTGANTVYHANIIRDCAVKRRIIQTATEIIRDAYEGGSSEDLLAESESKIQGIFNSATSDTIITPLSYAVNTIRGRFDDPRAEPNYIPTQFQSLDNIIGGWRPGRVHVIASRPGVGKSAFALACALNASLVGAPTLIISIEMDQDELAERTISIRSGVSLTSISRGTNLSDDEMQRIEMMPPTGPIYIVDTPSITVAKIAAITRKAIKRFGIKLVIIDYLQLITPANRKDPRHLQVAEDTKNIKILSRMCKIPIIELSQLNREKDANEEPSCLNLRESGSIEQDADTVIFLWRGIESGGPDQNIFGKVDKQRGGPLAKFEINYRKPCVRFENNHVKDW